jgi:hypothetical protein
VVVAVVVVALVSLVCVAVDPVVVVVPSVDSELVSVGLMLVAVVELTTGVLSAEVADVPLSEVAAVDDGMVSLADGQIWQPLIGTAAAARLIRIRKNRRIRRFISGSFFPDI